MVNEKNEPKFSFLTFNKKKFSSFQVLGFFFCCDEFLSSNQFLVLRALSVHKAMIEANKSDAFKEGKSLSISLLCECFMGLLC